MTFNDREFSQMNNVFKSVEAARVAVQSALHKTTSNYRAGEERGAVGLARKFGWNTGSTSNACQARVSEHEISLIKVLLIMRECNNFAVLQTLCSLCGFICVQQPDFTRMSDAALLDLWAEMLEKQGKHSSTVRMALADGRVTNKEMQEVRDSLQLMFSAGLAFNDRFAGLVQDE